MIRFLLTALSLLFAANSWADMNTELHRKNQVSQANWQSVMKKVEADDKSFCPSDKRKNMSECARAFALSQRIDFIDNLPNVSKMFLLALQVDTSKKRYDVASAGLVSMDSLLFFKSGLRLDALVCRQPPYNGSSATSKVKKFCSGEIAFLPKIIASWEQIISGLLLRFPAERKKNPASPETEAWRDARFQYISENYKKILHQDSAPLAQKPPKK